VTPCEQTDIQSNSYSLAITTVDCEGADSIRYGGAMGAAADSFIFRKLLMDIYIGHRWLKKLKRV